VWSHRWGGGVGGVLGGVEMSLPMTFMTIPVKMYVPNEQK